MIETKLGETKITEANYKLCNLLNCSKEDVDVAVRAGLTVDLCSILHAIKETHGIETALKMWLKAAEIITSEELDGKETI